jgi:hypothetical protein
MEAISPKIHKQNGTIYKVTTTMYDGKPEPKTYTQAIKSPDLQNWWSTMRVEFKNHIG